MIKSKKPMPVDLDAAEALLVGIDAGPWLADEPSLYIFAPGGMLADRHVEADVATKAEAENTLPVIRVRGFGRRAPQEANLKFIAASRMLVPALIAEVKRLRTEPTFDAQKPRPCPFCGSDKIRVLEQAGGWMSINCEVCYAEKREVTQFKSQIIASWNQRRKPE